MAQGRQAPAGFPEGLITYNRSKAAAALLVRRLLFVWDDFECAPVFHFHRRGRNGKQQLQRRFLRKRGAAERFPADLQRAEPSQALPRQLSQGESQAVKFITKVLGIMRKLPAVLLALPLRKDFPRSGGRCRAATKGGIWQARQGLTERAHTVALSAEVSDAIRSFPTIQKSSPFGGAGIAQR